MVLVVLCRQVLQDLTVLLVLVGQDFLFVPVDQMGLMVLQVLLNHVGLVVLELQHQ